MASTRRALVIGASGQVGKACVQAFQARGFEVTGTSASKEVAGLVRVDLRDHGRMLDLVKTVKPEVCVLSGAMSNVDGCESQRELAFAINAEAPGVVAEACRAQGTKVVFLSTEYVFDGTKGPYSEEDPPCPISVYGASKLEGEKRVLAASADNLSVRTTVVYSWDPQGSNFAMQLWRRLTAGEVMRVPVDQVSSPTWAPELGEAIATLHEKRVGGVMNVVGPEVMGRYAFARRLAEGLGLNAELLRPVETSELGQKARRPLNAGLTVGKLNSAAVKTRGPGEVIALIARAAAPGVAGA